MASGGFFCWLHFLILRPWGWRVLRPGLGRVCGSPRRPATDRRATRERAYRANNGVALLEQLKSRKRQRHSGRAHDRSDAGHRTLQPGPRALTIRTSTRGPRGDRCIEPYGECAAAGACPRLVARAQNRNEDARRFFERSPGGSNDVGANVNLAQIDLEDRRHDEAVSAAADRRARALSRDRLYVLGLAPTRSGKADEGQHLLQRAQDLRRELCRHVWHGYPSRGATPRPSVDGRRAGTGRPADTALLTPVRSSRRRRLRAAAIRRSVEGSRGPLDAGARLSYSARRGRDAGRCRR